MTIKTASPAPYSAGWHLPPQEPPAKPPPQGPNEKAPPSEEVPAAAWWFIGIVGCIFVIGPLEVFAPSLAALVVSMIALGWTIFLTVWIKKIKDRQTESVLVQTMSLQVLQEILSEIKKQNV